MNIPARNFSWYLVPYADLVYMGGISPSVWILKALHMRLTTKEGKFWHFTTLFLHYSFTKFVIDTNLWTKLLFRKNHNKTKIQLSYHSRHKLSVGSNIKYLSDQKTSDIRIWSIWENWHYWDTAVWSSHMKCDNLWFSTESENSASMTNIIL